MKVRAGPGSADGHRFKVVATGGTFDHIHSGHKKLLAKSFEAGDRVIIGLTSDEFVAKVGKKPDYDYAAREAALRDYIDEYFPGRKYAIAKLYDFFGPGIANAEVGALVASPETSKRLVLANKMRAEKGFPPLDLITVDWVEAQDGKPISSSRIRRGEIDEEGKLLETGDSDFHPGK